MLERTSRNRMSRKAIIVMLALGQDLSQKVFNRLEENEIRKLAQASAGLGDVSEEEMSLALIDFKRAFSDELVSQDSAGGMFRILVEKVFGQDRARNLLGAELAEDPFELCSRVDPEVLAKVLQQEHPQTTAMVLASLNSEQAGDVLEFFESDEVSDIIYRMGNLKQVQEDVIREVGDTVAAELAAKGSGQLRDSFDPLTTAVEVVKHLPQNDLESMFEKLESVDQEFADDLRSKMFLFDDLEKLDTRSMQRLLREIDGQLLTVALRGASDEVTEIIFNSMSQRAAEMLRDDLEAMGPVRLQDVQQAQQSIIDVAFRLEAEGIIVLPRGGAVELV